MPTITLHNLKKTFGAQIITNNINLTIPSGKTTVIIGRSGEGKSVLLKLIIGLIPPTSGSIIIDNINLTQLAEHERSFYVKHFGYVFQFAALLDSLTIFENIAITLLEKNVPIETIMPLVKESLALVHLQEDILYKYPAELSGGMRKRVGLARTLITKPNVMLYDEPTTGLDPVTTHVIHKLIMETQKKLNMTSIIVSHDREIFQYADYIALLHEGSIQYFGPASSIWDVDNPYIYQFIRGAMQGPIKTDYR